MKPFFSRLSYSLGNEDADTESEALGSKRGRVLCITGSGDRPLHLLLDECEEVVSLDLNPIQNYLLCLKMAAMKQFDYNTYFRFLGGAKSDTRMQDLDRLSSLLSPAAALFWRTNLRMIDKGVLFQGAVEKQANRISKILALFRRQKISKLFEFDNLEEQREFVKKELHTSFWKKAFDIAFHPKISKFWLKDPGLYEHIDPEVHPATYVYQRINNFLDKRLAKESLLLSFVILGHVNSQALPPYLSEGGVAKIKPKLAKITIKEGELVSFLENEPENSYDCFSLSDVASYLNEKDFIRLLKAMYHAGKPGARFCLRQFMSHYRIPQEMQRQFVCNEQLEKRLEERDRTIFYRFKVGTLYK